MKTNMIAELTAQALKEPALAGINNSELRQRVLSLAQLKLFKLVGGESMDRELLKDLLTVVKALSTLELREKDMAEHRALTETIRLNREEQRQREREARLAAKNNPTPPPQHALKTQPDSPSANPPSRPPIQVFNVEGSPATSTQPVIQPAEARQLPGPRLLEKQNQ